MRYDCGMPNDPKVNVTVRISPGELAAIDELADSLSRSRSDMIRQMLRSAIFTAQKSAPTVDWVK